jgi:hypothetical protein
VRSAFLTVLGVKNMAISLETFANQPHEPTWPRSPADHVSRLSFDAPLIRKT